MSTTTWRCLAVGVLALTLSACGGGGGGGGATTLRGKITDSSGSQSQSRGMQLEKLGGSGTVTATARVQVMTVNSNGLLTSVGETTVAAGGTYSVQVSANQTRLVVQSISGTGQVLAQAIVDSSGSAGETRTAPPMDSETSLEAEVLIEMVKSGVNIAQVNTIDLRARINEDMAAEARSAAAGGADVTGHIRALAQATAAAQRARIEWYSRNGVNTTQEALFQAQLSAASDLNVALDAEGDAERAYNEFHAALSRAETAAGVNARLRAEGENNSSAAFRATVQARLTGPGAPALLDVSLRSAASLEARASTAAVETMLTAASAAQAVQTSAAAAGARLRADIAAATSARQAAMAFSTYQVSISGGASVEGSVLGNFLAVNTATAATAQASVNAATTASAQLATAMSSSLAVAIGTGATVNVNAVAEAAARSYASYRSAVAAQASALAVFGTRAAPAVDLLVVAHGSFR